MLDEPFYSLYLLRENARPREKERERKKRHASWNNFTHFTTALLTLLGTHTRTHMCSSFVSSIALLLFSWIVNIFFCLSLTPHQVERLTWQRLAGRHRFCRGPRSAFVGLSHIEVFFTVWYSHIPHVRWEKLIFFLVPCRPSFTPSSTLLPPGQNYIFLIKKKFRVSEK